jgi:hypothetical protein
LPLHPVRDREGRKVRTPKGRMVASSDSGRPEESATEKTPPSGDGAASPGSKGEMAR